MKPVPVLIDFNMAKQIGVMEIDETKLPDNGEYWFTVALRTVAPHKFELEAISLVPCRPCHAPLPEPGPLTQSFPVADGFGPEVQMMSLLEKVVAGYAEHAGMQVDELRRVANWFACKYGDARLMLTAPAKA